MPNSLNVFDNDPYWRKKKDEMIKSLKRPWELKRRKMRHVPRDR